MHTTPDRHHQIELLEGGDAFFQALIAAIDGSTCEIYLETYIFHFEALAAQVAHALARAARRGVKVAVVVDGIGTPPIAPHWAARWREAGVRWHIYSPLGPIGLLVPVRWRRLHRKLCVVDGRIAFCGGINIQDDWIDLNHGVQQAPRYDFAVRITGPVVADIHQAVAHIWLRLDGRASFRRWSGPLAQAWKQRRQRRLRQGIKRDAEANRVVLVLRDNVQHRTRIERTYRKALAEAQTDVWIANAYFLPGRKLSAALIHAAQRGVRVRLLLQGRYEYFMQFHATRPAYAPLLAAGIEIYEYQQGFLHAKVAVIDGQWATVGSSNLEPLSLLLAREANVVVRDADFAQTLQNRLERAIAEHGVRVDPRLFAQRPWQQRCLDHLAYGLVRLSLFLTGRRY